MKAGEKGVETRSLRLLWVFYTWIINIWMRQEPKSDKKFSLVHIIGHMTSSKPMRIVYAILAAYPLKKYPCKSARWHCYSVVSCRRFGDNNSFLCQIKDECEQLKI